MSNETSFCLDARGVYYRQLNEQIRDLVDRGAKRIEVQNVNGQRYIAANVQAPVEFVLHGVPGQDLAAFMHGPVIRVKGNAQDGVANTMDDGLVVIEGLAGDVLGYGMRGGKVFVKKDVGYRVGIHMKAYEERLPVVVIGGNAGDFLGEYMAGGAIILLGLFTDKPDTPITGRSLGTGMHGGVIYVRAAVPEHLLGPGLHAEPADEADMVFVREQVTHFARELGCDAEDILAEQFMKVRPYSHRPYGSMYVGTN